MSGFFESVGLTKPAAAPVQQPAQQQNSQQPGGQQGANTSAQLPAGANQPNGNPTPNSNVNGSNQAVDPMAAYATMFTNNPDKQGEVAPSFTIDGKVLDTVTGQLDFTKNVPQDLMQKAMGGDMKSFMDIMNHVGREAYRNSLTHSSAMTDKFVGMREEFNGKRLPGMVREELTMGEITGGAGAKSPIVRQQLVEIAKKYQAANPDASPQQVAAAAKQYVADLYGALNPETSPAAQAKNNQAQTTDWDSYFDANM